MMSDYRNIVKVWLYIGLFMVFMQIIIGGITRLTGSGLSITKWEIVTGTLPPTNAAQWEKEFDLYKETPQYQKINQGMTMREFKFIYFWEYFHRLWARSMGFVFLIPFLIFWRLGYLDKVLMRRLGITVLIAAVVASFGWIMVASGLINRPWVNAYKLTMHLSLGLILMSYLFYVVFHAVNKAPAVTSVKGIKWMKGIIVVLIAQILLGGMMSGMKAALAYPTWPDMYGAFIPSVILDGAQWTAQNFVMYDENVFMPALVQFLHRMTAYVLFGLITWYAFIKKETGRLQKAGIIMFVVALFQVLLGILTIIKSKGTIPVDLGVYHQAGAIVLLLVVLYNRFIMKK